MQMKRFLIIVQEHVLVFVHHVKTGAKENVKVVKAAVKMVVKLHVAVDVDKHVKDVVNKCVSLVARQVVNLHVRVSVEELA